jgi:GNAT superfamily N-acetyltransferase
MASDRIRKDTMTIHRIDPTALDGHELAALYAFHRRILAERSPNDPIPPVESFGANMRNIPPIVEVTFWVAWDGTGEEVLGSANLIVPLMEGNEHLVQFELTVLPEHRRKGIGTELMHVIAAKTREIGRRLLITGTMGTVPAGEAFLRRVGASPALEGHTNDLRLEDVDLELMRRWVERPAERASDFEIGFWEGSYPEERLGEIAEMLDAFNTTPTGDLEVEDFHFSPEQVRGMERANAARGVIRWTCYVQEKTTKSIAGFTEIYINTHEPEMVEQGLTAVFEPYRNKGLGRWLKAAMVMKVLAEKPEVTVIRTGNADVNEPMLNINREMGFRPAMTQVVWQMELDQVEAYLAECAPVP